MISQECQWHNYPHAIHKPSFQKPLFKSTERLCFHPPTVRLPTKKSKTPFLSHSPPQTKCGPIGWDHRAGVTLVQNHSHAHLSKTSNPLSPKIPNPNPNPGPPEAPPSSTGSGSPLLSSGPGPTKTQSLRPSESPTKALSCTSLASALSAWLTRTAGPSDQSSADSASRSTNEICPWITSSWTSCRVSLAVVTIITVEAWACLEFSLAGDT